MDQKGFPKSLKSTRFVTTFYYIYVTVCFRLHLAFLTNCMVLLHTFWGVIFFAALDTKKWLHVVIVIASHMLFSGLVSHCFHVFVFCKYLVYQYCFYYLGTSTVFN